MKETIGLMLEVTSHCNMHCTFCPSDDLVRPKGHVSDEQAIQFILAAHEMAPGKSIMFNVLGEPFLNKKLFDYIALCEEHNVPASMFTNITLLNEERLKKLYQYRNVYLDMSLHTPTDKSFAERGYLKIKSFREYLDMVCNAIEAKYRYKSNVRINIYLASELTQNLMQSDAGDRLWTLFDNPDEYAAGWNLCAEMFTELGAKIQRDYPETFAAEMEIVKHAYQQQIQAGEIVFRAEDLPPWRLEKDTSGWICVPGVIVRRKGFGMWGYHEQFVKRHAQPNRFTFHEERTEAFKCPGAYAFGILSNGTYTLCCQDVEGQMDIGNIATMDPQTAFASPRREEIIENCATSSVCRRCAGNTMILDTEPIRYDSQTVDKFGFGWHPFESYLFGVGARWTMGSAKSYFYTRIEVERLSLDFRSAFPSATKFKILLSSYNRITKEFSLDVSEEFVGRKDQLVRVDLPAKLKKGAFYRLTILSPTYSPQEAYGSLDTRRLGIAVAAITCEGRPFEELAKNDVTLTLAHSNVAATNSSAYTFPILS
ncbi:MAG TPA: radical SAM/SPASM domain-containing protein [Candidatus Acidoferrales bacterium]